MNLAGDRPATAAMPNRRSESPGGGRRRAGLASADRLAGAGRMLLWLTPLTVLIWVYAEREQTVHTTGPNATGVAVSVVTTQADRYVELVGSPRTPTVNLKLTGPQNRVDEVKQQLAAQGLNIDLGSRYMPGEDRQVNVVEAIQNLPLFRNAGVSVDEAQPADLHVNIDRIEVVQNVDVRADPRTQVLIGPATFTPAQVTLRGPARQLADLAAFEKPTDGHLWVWADLSNLPDRPAAATGELPPIDVPLLLPTAESQVAKLPATVSAKQLSLTNATYQIPGGVPVLYLISPEVTQHYDIVLGTDDSTLPRVKVVGPPKQIAAIRSGDFEVVAVLRLTEADYARQNAPKPLTLVLPPGVSVSADYTVPMQSFKMTRRDPNGG